MNQAMELPRYDSYKPANSPWLLEVPCHWNLLPGLAILKANKDKNVGMIEDTVLSLSYGKVIIKPPEKLTGLVPESFETYQIINPNDIIIRPTDLQNDHTSLRTGFAKDRGIITSAYICLRPEPSHNPAFIHYLLHAYDLLKVFYGMGSGLRQNLDYRDFKRLELCIPPRDEQDRITNFLDQKTAEVDEAIAKKQHLIDLLKEQKNILINLAVTKGLHPNVPMRDSGLKWLGDVPEHWEIKKNRELFTERKESGSESLPILTVSLHTGVSDNEQDETENIRSKIRIEDKTCYRRVYPGDIAFNMMRAWQGAIGVVKTDGQVSPAYIIASTCSLIDGEYFEYQYRTSKFIGQMDRSSKGITDFRKRLYWAEFKQLSTIVPPLDEQKKIVETIRDISKATDQVVESVVREIEQLKEFRSVLISEAVTGKIKI